MPKKTTPIFILMEPKLATSYAKQLALNNLVQPTLIMKPKRRLKILLGCVRSAFHVFPKPTAWLFGWGTSRIQMIVLS